MRTRLITLSSILVLTAFGAGIASAEELATRTTNLSAVTVAVTPRTFSAANWDFEVVFTTHSGALKDDPVTASTLVTDAGKTFSPVKWQGDAPGGHHRKGVLQFKAISPRPAWIELRMTREGEPQPRVFKWEVKGR